jgi:anti-sigma B factor antagonist
VVPVAFEFALTSAYLAGNAHVVTVTGDLDYSTAPRLREELVRASDEGAREIVVDILKVPFVDSVALGVLIEASKRTCARGAVFTVVCDDRRIARIIEITGLEETFRIHTTLHAALESVESDPAPTVPA